MRPFAKIVTYLALSIMALGFLLPFLWMLSTAFKPLDQTLKQPPDWLPRRYFVGEGAARHEVKPGAAVIVPSVWATPAGSPQPAALPADEVRHGQWTLANGTVLAVTVLREVPATPAAPWREVTDRNSAARDIVPAASIHAVIAPRWENFPAAMRAMGHFARYTGNTVLLCVLNVVGTVLSSALAAYGFSRIEWRHRERVFGLALATMMIPFPVVMVPLYALFRALGWVGTLQPLWVGAFFANAFNVFLLRQFFRNIPKELSEAAWIDGCGELRIFWSIILPLCRPALIVVALFTFLGTWNDFLGPLIYLTEQRDYTLALGLQAFQSKSGGTEWHYLMAASTLVILPIIALFLAAQRHFVEGIALTGSKT